MSFSRDRRSAQALAKRSGELAREGVEFVLVREKQLAAGELAEVCREVLQAVRAANSATKVLVAGRLDIAVSVGADGVNLSGAAGELTAAQVRELMPGAFVSVSCHSVADVVWARGTGADAALFGPVFGKTVDGVEVAPGIGLEALRDACHVAGKMPVLALGGISAGNATQCLAVGAAGVAGIRMYFR